MALDSGMAGLGRLDTGTVVAVIAPALNNVDHLGAQGRSLWARVGRVRPLEGIGVTGNGCGCGLFVA